MTCDHPSFEAATRVARLTSEEAGPVTGFMLELRVNCAKCGRKFQFLGLEPGVNLRGARVSIDGLEANLAMCPQGEQPSALDQIAVNFPTQRKH